MAVDDVGYFLAFLDVFRHLLFGELAVPFAVQVADMFKFFVAVFVVDSIVEARATVDGSRCAALSVEFEDFAVWPCEQTYVVGGFFADDGVARADECSVAVVGGLAVDGDYWQSLFIYFRDDGSESFGFVGRHHEEVDVLRHEPLDVCYLFFVGILSVGHYEVDVSPLHGVGGEVTVHL